MDPDIIIKFLVIVVLLVLSAFFSSAETALTTVSRLRVMTLAEEGNKSASVLLKVIDNKEKMLSAILIGNNIVNISVSSLTTILVTNLFGSYAVSIATGLLTILVLIFGEITPKTFATLHNEKISLKYARIIYAIMWVLTPVIFIINKLAFLVMLLFKSENSAKTSTYTENELKTIVNVSHAEGVIETEEHEMLQNIFEFSDRQAKDVMIPRVDVCMLEVSSTYDEIMETFRANRYTRIPIYEDSTDNVIGIINIKDLVLYKHGESFSIRNYLREPYYTYEYKKLSDLLLEMKKASANITIILDEYGAASGLLTLEDLVEEIVGDIKDEYDYDEEDLLKAVSDTEYIVEAQMNLDDFNDILGTKLVSDEYDSVGGFIIEHLDRMAHTGDMVETPDISFLVDSTDKNRIEKVHVFLHKDEKKEVSA
ncbi:MAG: hemolysin family protein [Lachnospiraceae bacterium]|nr:HlyC/CorC family transporter [Lachnospiraceae bacterium]MCI9369388.1 HlyC/CorC family transporter [Lachnospiraceae bacterium]MDE7308301.1 hemolysin family protein [Lachnospiraceae bacterium]